MNKALAVTAFIFALWWTVAAYASLLTAAKNAANGGQFQRAEQLLRQWLGGHRSDREARFLLARVLSWQGKFAAALAQYETLLRKEPRSADYLLGKAQTLVWDHRAEEALPLLKRARRISPGYSDIWRAQITALLDAGGADRVRQAALIETEAGRRFPKERWGLVAARRKTRPAPVVASPAVAVPAPARVVRRKAQPASPRVPSSVAVPVAAPRSPSSPADGTAPSAARRRVPLFPSSDEPDVQAAGRREVEAGFSYEHLGQGYDAWKNSYLTASGPLGGGRMAYATVQQTERFALRDFQALGGIYLPLGGRWSALLEAKGSTTHRVLPKWSVLGQLGYALEGGWTIQAGLRRTGYNDSASVTSSLTAERYWGNFRAAYTLSGTRLDVGGSALGHKLQGSYYYGTGSSVGLSLVSGDEVEYVPARGVLTTRVRSLVFSGVHWFAPVWAVSYEILLHEQGDSYTRKGFRIGLRRAF